MLSNFTCAHLCARQLCPILSCQCPFTLAPSSRRFMDPFVANGRPPKRQRLKALMLWRAASKSTASSALSSDCSRVIS